MVEKLKKVKVLNDFIPFIVCKNRNRSALLRELLSNISLFVGQLYADTTDLQIVIYYSTFHY